ncbi:hypothetical protein TrLO_g10362 [Triparma laevis f. longispina]|uniref:Uncharacterized protein n=1 Tax=Triparma laevis f. longispina TaxID=1714387 RepID=A0A9W6Z9A7_9STRA|nr:hypothetical protein TrLO_g10362 [Triparma laevis f. longispina]
MSSYLPSNVSSTLFARTSRHFSTKTPGSTSGVGILAWYSRMLETNPIPTKALSAGTIAGLGDLNCQYLDAYRKGTKCEYDAARTCRFAFLGFFLIAPVTHNWYNFLMTQIPGSGALAIAKRVLLDQLIFAPLFIPAFFISVKTLEGSTLSSSISELKNVFLDMYTTNLFLWVPASTINFAFVPQKFMVLFGNCVGLIWNTYVSFKSN